MQPRIPDLSRMVDVQCIAFWDADWLDMTIFLGFSGWACLVVDLWLDSMIIL